MDYPTDEELEKVKTWKPQEGETWKPLFDYVKDLWNYADCGYWEEPREGVYHISCAGWSGNEELMDAMHRNRIFWLMCWWESKRGGHYKFKLPHVKGNL